MPVCVLFVSSRSGIVFYPSAGEFTDHSQSAKDIDPYFKSKLYVKDPGNRKPLLIYGMGWVNPESERMTESFISVVGGIRTHNLVIDSPASYHWAITDLKWYMITLLLQYWVIL